MVCVICGDPTPSQTPPGSTRYKLLDADKNEIGGVCEKHGKKLFKDFERSQECNYDSNPPYYGIQKLEYPDAGNPSGNAHPTERAVLCTQHFSPDRAGNIQLP